MTDLERPPIALRSEVLVEEGGIRPWGGTVLSLKFSATSGWWVEVRRDDGRTYSVPSRFVRPLEIAHA